MSRKGLFLLLIALMIAATLAVEGSSSLHIWNRRALPNPTQPTSTSFPPAAAPTSPSSLPETASTSRPLSIFSTSTQPPTNQNVDWKKYRTHDYGFEIQYRSDASIKTHVAANSRAYSDTDETVVFSYPVP